MPKICAHCGISGSVKKWRFIHHFYQKSYLCGPCISELGSARLAQEWLESQDFTEKYNVSGSFNRKALQIRIGKLL